MDWSIFWKFSGWLLVVFTILCAFLRYLFGSPECVNFQFVIHAFLHLWVFAPFDLPTMSEQPPKREEITRPRWNVLVYREDESISIFFLIFLRTFICWVVQLRHYTVALSRAPPIDLLYTFNSTVPIELLYTTQLIRVISQLHNPKKSLWVVFLWNPLVGRLVRVWPEHLQI